MSIRSWSVPTCLTLLPFITSVRAVSESMVYAFDLYDPIRGILLIPVTVVQIMRV